LRLNSGCEIFDKPGTTVFGRRCEFVIHRVVRKVVPNGAPGSAKRAGNTGHEHHPVEKSENAGSQF
jgi:hypothetical protein